MKRLAVLVVALSAALAVAPAGATIFAALTSPDSLAASRAQARKDFERVLPGVGAMDVKESDGFGLPRVDGSKAPAVIAAGEMKSRWHGLWQLGGGRIVVNRAQDADIPFNGASEQVQVSAAWVAGNEAVAAKARHVFGLRVFRANADGTFTEVA